MTATIRLVDDFGTSIWLHNPALGFPDGIITAKHTLSSAAPRESKQPRAGRSGVVVRTAYHDDATFQADLSILDIVGGLTRHQTTDRLRAVLQAGRTPTLYIQRDGWLTERSAEVRAASSAITSGVDAHSGAYLSVSIQVTIPEGVLKGADASDTIRPASLASGRFYPKIYTNTGWSYTAGSSGSVKIITTGGGEYGVTDTPLLMRLYGACTDPVITNETTGAVFELDGVSILDGQYMEIDMDAHTVHLNGDPALSYYSAINFATSSWWDLAPGANTLSVGAATIDSSCELDLFWTSRFAL